VKKVLIIGLVLLGLVMIALLVWRPGGSSRNADSPGFARLIGGLIPRQDLKPADVAGQPCWDGAGQMVVQQGQRCQTSLPDAADRMKICLQQGALTGFEIKGSKYGPQSPDANQIPCGAGGQTFDLYDQQSVLTVTCAPIGSCLLRLL